MQERRKSKNLPKVDLYKMTEIDLPALWVLVEALAGSKFFTRSKLSSSRPSLSSGMTIVAFSLQINTHTTPVRSQHLSTAHFDRYFQGAL